MLEKQESYSSIELKEKGQVQLRKTVKVIEDGSVLSESHQREIRYPDQDISDLPQNIQDVINAHWTQEIKDAWAEYSEQINQNFN